MMNKKIAIFVFFLVIISSMLGTTTVYGGLPPEDPPPPSSDISGYIKDSETYLGISGAIVYLYGYDPDTCQRVNLGIAYTDANGRYDFWDVSIEGSYEVEVWHFRYYTYSGPILSTIYLTIKDHLPINIITPSDTTYTAPMAGYYPATHGFEDTENGCVPDGWSEYSPGNAFVRVKSEFGNHKKVLELNDPWQDSYPTFACVNSSFENQGYGTIEFWFYTTNCDGRHVINLRNVDDYGFTNCISLLVDWGSLFYAVSGSWVEVPGLNLYSIFSYNWYRFKIDFETTLSLYQGLTSYKFKVTVNEDISKPMSFTNDEKINNLLFMTDGFDHDYSMFIDAVGFSWDPYYEIMDNKYEGLLLDFEPTNLIYMSYTLDGESRTIHGDTVFRMPKSDDQTISTDDHTISVYGVDSLGMDYYSVVRKFSVDRAEKIGVIFYSSDSGELTMGSTTQSETVESHILKYRDILAVEGYTKFYIFRDVGSLSEFRAIMGNLADNIVDFQDEIFFYIQSHGKYDDYYKYSIAFIFSIGDRFYGITSNELRGFLDDIAFNEDTNPDGTKKIGLLVDACYSGTFASGFPESPYLAIASASIDEYSWGTWGEHNFAANFWYAVLWHNDAYEAFYFAYDKVWPRQTPIMAYNTPGPFVFFA